jgi:Polyketide cyclase / dehydrase and lipid transport
MRLSHRVRTAASPAEVWELLGTPQRWPEFDLLLRSVRGSHGSAASGQHLLGLARVASLRIPVDVVEAVRDRRLVLLVHTAPGLRETVTHEITPTLQGGSDVVVSVVVEGLWARLGVVPLWLATGVNARLLAARTDRSARRQRRERSA